MGQANSQEPGGGEDEQGIGLGSEAQPLPLVPSVALPTKLGIGNPPGEQSLRRRAKCPWQDKGEEGVGASQRSWT